MDMMSRIFCVAVIVADLLAIVFFGGHFISTGHPFPSPRADAARIAAIIPVEDGATTTVAAKPVEEEVLMAADPTRGEKVAAKCRACHSFEQGGPNRIGPNLWGTYNAGIAHVSGFAYSDAFVGKKGEITWNDEHLDGFLASPRRYLKGTKMAFAGLSKKQERIDIIEYLKTLR